MLRRPKVSPMRRRVRRYAAIAAVILITGAVYTELVVKAQLKDIIIRDMQTVSVQAVNKAVEEFLTENRDAGERIVDIAYSGGEVAAVTSDPYYINYIKAYVTDSAQRRIDAMSHNKAVSARLGSFTGLTVLSGVGPEVSFDVESSRTVSCEFESTFESAGVNQTVHHIMLTVTVELEVSSPFRIDHTIETTTSYEIAQTVIVGSVPNYSGVLAY